MLLCQFPHPTPHDQRIWKRNGFKSWEKHWKKINLTTSYQQWNIQLKRVVPKNAIALLNQLRKIDGRKYALELPSSDYTPTENLSIQAPSCI